MDELAAAAAVVIMAMDCFAGQHVGQRGFCGTVCGHHSQWLLERAKAEDKEHNGGHAAAGDPEDAAVQVSHAPPVLICSQ